MFSIIKFILLCMSPDPVIYSCLVLLTLKARANLSRMLLLAMSGSQPVSEDGMCTSCNMQCDILYMCIPSTCSAQFPKSTEALVWALILLHNYLISRTYYSHKSTGGVQLSIIPLQKKACSLLHLQENPLQSKDIVVDIHSSTG